MGAVVSRIARAAVLAAVALCAQAAFALGPHEVAVLANDESLDSVLLARAYMRMRAIPDRNLVRVRLPKGKNGAFPEFISKDAYLERIWNPCLEELKKAGISQQVLALVYSCDFPVRVCASPTNTAPCSADLSLTGATFVRGRWPKDEAVSNGTFISPLFSAPSVADVPGGPAHSFDVDRNRLIGDMPMPAAMLAWTGPRGLSVDEALSALEAASTNDFTAPRGAFRFFCNEDIRSTCRDWQYAAAAERLRELGFRTIVSTNPPSATEPPVLGFLSGNRKAHVPPTFAKGVAFADHLTSFGAAFWTTSQEKVTSWLRAGAAFTAGTVVEPYALWQKFPAAWMFVDLAEGCTAMEAFYASVRCPLQTLLLGDPLSRPWAPVVEPVLTGPAEETVSGAVELRVSLPGRPESDAVRFNWLVDGRPAGTGRVLLWNTQREKNGVHCIRAVARVQNGEIRHQGFAEILYEVENP